MYVCVASLFFISPLNSLLNELIRTLAQLSFPKRNTEFLPISTFC